MDEGAVRGSEIAVIAVPAALYREPAARRRIPIFLRQFGNAHTAYRGGPAPARSRNLDVEILGFPNGTTAAAAW